MFGRGRGGIEQAFVDYAEVLRNTGHEVTAILAPEASIISETETLSIPFIQIKNWGAWDFGAVARLRETFAQIKPDAIITHGNRALTLCAKSYRKLCPLVGVAHNYNIQHLHKADAVFAITRDLADKLAESGIKREIIYHIPNMVRLEKGFVKSARKSVVTIGTMGRLVKKKGFHIFIEALEQIHKRGILFKAIIGGDGEEFHNLAAQIKSAGLEDVISLPGWVNDKKAFFAETDLFCLPSIHEPFGIVLLEAFANKVPVITTDAEGPRDIVEPGVDALMVPREDPAALAAAIIQLMDDEATARELATSALTKVKEQYSLPVIGEKISAALNQIV